MIITFSNRCFPTKAVEVWGALDGPGHVRLVKLYLERAGFAEVETRDLVAEGGLTDPVHAVIGRTSAVVSAAA